MSNNVMRINQPVEGTFEGKPTISIPLDGGRPFTFGIEKSHSIVKWIDAVKAFAAKNPSRAQRLSPADVKAAVASMSDEDKAAMRALLGQ
jgi:hypothetical protein